jgi:hypothetical protein
VTGAWVHQATGQLAANGVFLARLVATVAGVDFIATAGRGD